MPGVSCCSVGVVCGDDDGGNGNGNGGGTEETGPWSSWAGAETSSSLDSDSGSGSGSGSAIVGRALGIGGVCDCGTTAESLVPAIWAGLTAAAPAAAAFSGGRGGFDMSRASGSAWGLRADGGSWWWWCGGVGEGGVFFGDRAKNGAIDGLSSRKRTVSVQLATQCGCACSAPCSHQRY